MKNRTAKRLLSLVLIAALTMTLFVGVVSPTRAAAAEFSDVNGHWAKNSIVRWMDEDVIHGYPDGTFRPNDKITRAEFATVLKNLLRLTEQAENPFSDLPDNWMKKPVLCLVKEGVIKGYSDGTFKPNNKILRQEAFTMICRAFYFPKAKDTDLSVFSDGEDVGNYAKGYIKTLVDLGAIRGYPDGTILPKEPISRAEIMTVLDRLISLYVNEDDTKAEAKKSFVLVVADNAVLTAPTDSYVIARRSWKNLRVNCIPVDDEQLYLVPAERHVPVTDAAVPATCTKDGLTEGCCSFCGEILTAQQKIPALGHLWDEAAFEWDGLDSATATRVCKRDESHVEKAESVITSKVTTEPTNADAGARLYTAEATFNDGTVATDHKTEILPPIGYTYGDPGWNWSNDGSGAYATFTANEDPAVKVTAPAEVTGKVTKQPTCTAKGETTYTATVNFNSETYTSTKTVADVDPLGHDWGDAAFTWDGVETATATRICKNDASHKETVPAIITNEVTKEPTAEGTGTRTYTATAMFPDGTKATDTRTDVIPATGYTYGSPDWTWKDDGSGAQAVFPANENPSKKETVPANVTDKITKEPTCTEAGETTYTATVLFNGELYTSTKTLADVSPLGHAEVIDPAVPATCTEAGLTEGRRCSRCGEILVAQDTVSALGHDWGEAAFTWDGFSAVSATRTCRNDESHVDTAVSCTDDGGVVTKKPTPTAEGEKVYTATATFADGTVATDTKTEILPATGYTYGDPVWSWANDRTLAYATFTAVEDPEHQVTIPAEITEGSSKEPTCLEAGETGYIGTVIFDGKTYTDAKTLQTQEALGHDWGEWNVSTAPTCTEAGEETRTCARCSEKETRAVDALGHDLVDHEAKEPTCTEIGWDAYQTCSRCDYSTYAEKAALGHDLIDHEAKEPTCTEIGWDAYQTCSRCDYSTYAEKAALGHDWVAPVWHVGEDGTLTKVTHCSRCDETQEETFARKFLTSVTDPNQVKVSGAAFDNYYATLVIPANATVNSSYAQILLEMTDVASLGIEGTRSHSLIVQTGIEREVPLDSWIGNLIDLEALTVQGTIDGKPYSYELSREVEQDKGREDAYYAYLMTTDTAETRTAWQALTAALSSTTQAADDSYIVIKHGAYAQIGTEKLEFERGGDLKLDNIHDAHSVNEAMNAIREAVVLHTGVTAAETPVEIFLPKGTTLAVGSSVVTLQRDAKITADGLEADGILSRLQASGNADMLKNTLIMMNEALAGMNGKTLTVNVEFLDHEHVAGAAVRENEKEPTCTEAGSHDEVVYCTICEEELSRTPVEDAALGHDWGEWTVSKEATCTEAGEETRTCARCSEKETRAVDALGHDWLAPVWHVGEDGTLTKVTHCSRCDETQEETFARKFLTSVTDPNQVKVSGAAFDNYYATLVIPANATVNSSYAQILLEMTDVASLGIEGTRSHSLIVQTGIEREVPLDSWIGNLIDLEALTVQGTIDGKPYSYELSREVEQDKGREDAYYAYLMTTDTAETRTAWQALTAALSSTTQAADDSYIVIKHGAYAQIGTEKLEFERGGDLKLDNIHDAHSVNEAMNAIREAVVLHTGVTAAETPVEIFLPKGTTLAVGSSVVTLERDAKITADGLEADGILSRLQASGNADMLKNTLIMMNEALAGMNGKTLTVNVEFLDHEHVTGAAVRENEKEPTCTEAGSHDEIVYCTICEEELSRTPVEDAALGHDWGEWTVSKEATCTEAGEETRTCARCSEKETRAVDALGHDWGETYYQVNEDGVLVGMHKCARCDTATQAETFSEKIYAAVADGDQTDKVIGTAFDNYDLTFVMPKTADNTENLDMSAAYLWFRSDVSGVTLPEVNGRKVNTPWAGETASLDNWLSSVPAFESGNIHGTVNGNAYNYDLSIPAKENDNYYAILAETDTDQARACWRGLVDDDSIYSSEADPDGTASVLIRSGTVQIGTEKLRFKDGADDLQFGTEYLNKIPELIEKIKSTVVLDTDVSAAETDAVAYLRAGSVVEVKDKLYTLRKDVTVTVDNLDMTQFSTLLSDIRTSANRGDMSQAAWEIAQRMVEALNGFIGSLEREGGVALNVIFTEHAHEFQTSYTVGADGQLYKSESCWCGEARETACTEKFYCSVTDESEATTAAATAFDNYCATFVLPKAATVDYSGATLSVRMTDVESLGISGTRSHSLHLSTTMSGDVNLENWLDLSSFAGGTVSGTIDGIPYEYSLSNVSPEDGNYYAILAETETAETRLAWQALTEQINSATQAEDSYVLIKNGSTIQIGTEQLSFETGDDLLLDNLNDLSSLQDAVRSHLQLTTGAAAAEGQIVIVLKAGTQLAVGGSVATLKKDATIVVNGMSDTANLDTLLSSLRNTDDVATMVKKLVYSIGDITNSVNSGGITVNVSFSEES